MEVSKKSADCDMTYSNGNNGEAVAANATGQETGN